MTFIPRFRAALIAVACLLLGMSGPLQAQGSSGSVKASAKARVIVGFKSGASAGARAAINNAGGQVVLDLSEVNGLAAELPASAIAALRRNSNVEFVEDDPVRRLLGRPVPSVSQPAALPGTPETVPYGIGMVQADQVSDSLAGNRKICIIDSGIDRTHEDLAGIVSIDGTNLTRSGQWFTDENSHGTHVAGTVAALNNTVGVVGVLPNARIALYIVKVFDAAGTAPDSVIARGMLDCLAAGANVVSMSLGGDAPSRVGVRAADRLEQSNILMIAAAGNDGNTAVSYPAGYANVVSVAAIDSKRQVADFSQKNADVELAAPGVGVLSTVPIGSQVAATVTVGTSSYPALPMEGSPNTSATGPLANFGLGDTPVAGSMTGKVCLISRGAISFAAKVLNCQNSGGVGAIVYNNTTGDLNGTLGETVTTIPSVGTQQANGEAMLRQLGQSTTVSVFTTGDAYAFFNGTSMATPHVSGVAALVWSYYLNCTANQIRSSLNKSARDLGAKGRDNEYGFGLVQAKAAFDRIGSQGCGN
jgi:subtilisin family serine protease